MTEDLSGRLIALRDRIQALKDGTLLPPPLPGVGKHRRARERFEVETIHKTLNVVLSEADALITALLRPQLQENKEEETTDDPRNRPTSDV